MLSDANYIRIVLASEKLGGKKALGIALLIIVVVAATGRVLTKDQSKRRNRIVWGILVMIVLNPFVSWLIGICFAIFAGEGFAGMGVMVILFISMFFMGACILISGLLTKVEIE